MFTGKYDPNYACGRDDGALFSIVPFLDRACACSCGVRDLAVGLALARADAVGLAALRFFSPGHGKACDLFTSFLGRFGAVSCPCLSAVFVMLAPIRLRIGPGAAGRALRLLSSDMGTHVDGITLVCDFCKLK